VKSKKRLLRGARRFDTKILAEIYDQYSPGLYRYAMRLMGDTQQAEDCVAETFSRFLRALRGGGGPRDHLQAYLYRVAHNWITDQYRRATPISSPLDGAVFLNGGTDTFEAVAATLEQERVRSALKLLTADQRQVIMLKFLEGWSNKETAAALGKTEGAVKSLQHRALAALERILLAEDQPHEKK